MFLSKTFMILFIYSPLNLDFQPLINFFLIFPYLKQHFAVQLFFGEIKGFV